MDCTSHANSSLSFLNNASIAASLLYNLPNGQQTMLDDIAVDFVDAVALGKGIGLAPM